MMVWVQNYNVMMIIDNEDILSYNLWIYCMMA
jgi:hypothetical protein